MGGGPVRPFNAINGDELMKVILTDIRKTLNLEPKFARSCIYMEATYRYNIVVDAYPMEPPNFAIKPDPKTLKACTGEQLKDAILQDMTSQMTNDSRFRHHLTYPTVAFQWKTACDVTEPGPQAQIDNEGGIDVTAPHGGISADAARREAGIPVPVPTQVKGPSGDRVTVDSAQVGPKGPTTSRTDTPQREVSTQTDVPAGDRVIARSVTVKTAAAPTGVEVDGPGGTKPDMERVQQILEKEESDAAIDRSSPEPA